MNLRPLHKKLAEPWEQQVEEFCQILLREEKGKGFH